VVIATTLDAALDCRVTGLKIVEVHELHVLEGAEKVIASRPWVIVEFNRALTGTEQVGTWDVHRYLTSRGLHGYRVGRNSCR